LHRNKFRTYITDKVGVFHDPFTSYKNKEQTKEKLNVDQFAQLARKNMYEGFVNKYGSDWMQILVDAVPSDVSKEALFMWLYANDGFRGRSA
jgi:hypothetical protein